MTKNINMICPICGSEIINTRNSVQPYNDFDDYIGHRCIGCKKMFSETEILAIIETNNSDSHFIGVYND